MIYLKSAIALALFSSTVNHSSAFAPNLPNFARKAATTQLLHVSTSSGDVQTGGVTVTETTHKLFFVEGVEEIENGVPNDDFTREVRALELKNNRGVSVKCMAEGGNMVALDVGGTSYIWDNVEGACYYGPKSDAFPFQRGLILHGGVRFAAVCAEHGLYYDTEWEMTSTTSDDGNEKSIVMRIQDTDENRMIASEGPKGDYRDPSLYPGGFSSGAFSRSDIQGPMSKYPVTNMIFTYTVTLREDEDFVRLNMKVENPTDEVQHAEAWLPMTFPIDRDSYILSDQKKRWRRDEWFAPQLANIVDVDSDDMKDYQKPLDWPTPIGGILYDFPSKEGVFHGVTTNPKEGKGIFYVTPDDGKHYTKMWSWGNPDLFNREEALKQVPPLAAGRPAAEYYEPWSSGTNFAFFQTSQFEPKMSYSWEVALLPIQEGLTSDNQEKLKDKVREEVQNRGIPASLSGVVVEPWKGGLAP